VSQEILQAIIGMAVTDREFREALLSQPRAAVEGFALSDEELSVVSSIRAKTLERFAARLEQRLSKLSVKRGQRDSQPASLANDLRRIAR